MRRHLFLLVILLLAAGCGTRLTPEQKAVRAELRQALREGAFDRATVLARRVLETASHENGAWDRLVRAQLGTGDLDGATESLAQWKASVRRTSSKFDERTGDVAWKRGNAGDAVAAWARARKANSANQRVLNKLARGNRALGRWADEEEALTAVLSLNDNGTTRIERALVRRRLGRWDESIEDARRARQLEPDNLQVSRGAKLLEQLSKFLDPIRALDARLTSSPDDDQLLADRALLFLRAGDPEVALDDARKASELEPSALRPVLFQILALSALERPAEAAALTGGDSTLQLEHLTPEFLETIARLDAEIATEPSDAEFYVARAWQLNDLSQPHLALSEAEKALALNPNSAGALAESGYALAKLGRSDEAFARITKGTGADPNYSTVWQYRGELEMRQGQYAAAIESFTRALNINQTVAVLRRREEAYRAAGLAQRADEDRDRVQQIEGAGAR